MVFLFYKYLYVNNTTMTKKEMIDILVKEENFNESELNDMLKAEVEELFDSLFTEEDENSSKIEKKDSTSLKYDEDYVDTSSPKALVDKPTIPEIEEKEEIEIPLSRSQKRQLRRIGKL